MGIHELNKSRMWRNEINIKERITTNEIQASRNGPVIHVHVPFEIRDVIFRFRPSVNHWQIWSYKTVLSTTLSNRNKIHTPILNANIRTEERQRRVLSLFNQIAQGAF